MTINKPLKTIALACIFLAITANAYGAATSLSDVPLVTSSATNVLPNLMFVLDDSGSMDWDYMPDNARNFAGNYGFNSSQCNGTYYNPAITYNPPVDSTGAPLNATATSFTAAYRDGYVTGTGTVNLTSGFTGGSGSGSSGISLAAGPAFYYTYSGTQTAAAQKNYFTTTNTFYTECNSAIGSAPGNVVFQKVRLAASPVTTITVAGGGNGTPATITVSGSGRGGTSVSSIKVGSACPTLGTNCVQILSAATGGSSKTATVATAIAAGINACTTAATGNCTVNGYSATVSGSVVTLFGPAEAANLTPVLTYNNPLTLTATAFPTVVPTSVKSITVNGVELLSGATASTNIRSTMASSIASGITASGYSATASGNVVTITGPTSASTYTPVISVSPASVGMTLSTDAFPESTPAKLQNFANWYSYYSTRMLMMKTGVGQAFTSVTDKYRVGFLTMNNNVSPGIVEAAPFNVAQKTLWYNKLYASNPGNSTPLREALSHVGLYYAHKFGDVTTYKATLTVGGSGSSSVDSVTVGGIETMFDTTGASTSTGTIAAKISAQINTLDPSDFGATVSGNVVTIMGVASALNITPLASITGTMTVTATPFTSTTVTRQLNGITPADPMQYSCQQNFTILSTDGYWNGSTTYDLQNNPVGQRDGTELPPYNDGATQMQTTKQLQMTQSQTTRSTSQLQSDTLQNQSITGPLQMITNLQKTTAPLLWATNLQQATGSLQRSTVTSYTSTPYVLQIKTSSAGSYGNAAKNKTYNCSSTTTPSTASPNCQLGTASAATTGLASCTATYNNPGSTATDGNKAVTVCTAVWSPATNVGANGTCNASSTVTCSMGTSTPVYVASYPPACTATFNANGSNTADGSGNVVVASCSNTGSTYSSATAVAANGSCDGTLANVQCSYGSQATSYVTTNPPACALSWNGASASSTADASGKVTTACPPVSAAFNTTWTDVAAAGGSSCTPGANVNCRYNWPAAWSNVNATPSSCTPNYSSGAGAWTIMSGTDCRTTDSGWVGANCTAGVIGGQTTTCRTVTTGPTVVDPATCTTPFTPAGSGNSYTQTSCNTSLGTPTGVASCTQGTGPAPNYVTTSCNLVSIGPGAVSSCTAAVASASNNYTATTCTGGTGGVSNTLADVAEYYYVTDLRDGTLGNCTGAVVPPATIGGSVCMNNVHPAGVDAAAHQHMTTFTLGLGARGRMIFSPSYLKDKSGDFYSVKNGLTAHPAATPPICSWLADGMTCTWPTPASGAIENIDDLWHAAINGRGDFFSATDPVTLASGITTALSKIDTVTGSSAAATTSNPNITSGDNFVFSSTFTTTEWDGELVRQQLDLTNGATSTTVDWAAQAQLDTQAALTAKAASRTIYTYSAVATNHLKAFNETNFGTNINFIMPHISTSPDGLTQFMCASSTICLSTADQTLASGNALVNFLRGDRSNEGADTDNTKYFRLRTHVLGDIVNAEAVYVKGSLFNYSAAGYSDFVTSNKTRQGMVYAAANDGMLHAFNAGGSTVTTGDGSGAELWAYIPSLMLPNLYRLADKKYSAVGYHRYFVDGTPVVGDICPNAPSSACSGAQWKTILVGGFNKGGNGYYALDITDPASPKALWEFTDSNLGYSYGNPTITRLKDGTWVVIVASGYNNVPAPNGTGGDGVGRLYVLNAVTGLPVGSINGFGTISTGVGNTTTPSGLAHLAVYVNDSMTDNTAQAVYGGDLLGNLWRFDVNNDTGAAGYDAQLLTTLIGPTGVVQPITTAPTLGDVSGNRVVYLGTGQYLSTGDLNVVDTQSIYAIKDPLLTGTVANAAIYANPRSLTTFINQTPTNTTCPPNSPSAICSVGQIVRTSPNNTVNFATDSGWYMDLPDTGERVDTDPVLALGTLGFTTNVPSASTDACAVGGYSYRYFMDYKTGGAVSTSTTAVISTKLDNALATRPVYVRLPNGVVVELTRLSTGKTMTSTVPIPPGGSATRRTSWRELSVE